MAFKAIIIVNAVYEYSTINIKKESMVAVSWKYFSIYA